MASLFEIAILKLKELGFFNFLLPFILTAAIIYGGLRRAKIFGDPDANMAVNAIVAFVVSLFVWAAPIILGVDIEGKLASFFIQGFSVSLIVLVGLIFAGMFFKPDLAGDLSDKIKSTYFWGAILIISLMVAVVIFISSGLATVLFPKGTGFTIPPDTFITVGVLFLLAISVAVIVRSGK
ncbi:MAG: hypothetical protein HYW24_01515 [Candidatus Aenigmarchaeota archaeon]|nr:hypothetical protein [Candidatus Aenigmarchaeota archaeon]